MVTNMKQVNKMLENVNNDMNAVELTKVMDKFEQVRNFFFYEKSQIFFLNLDI
jgi:hypothetical protein